MICYDVETTGSDLIHGVEPFFAASCREDGFLRWWEWPVDPFTRKPSVPSHESDQVADLLTSEPIVAHNANFDLLATEVLLKDKPYKLEWDWDAIDDTLIASHVFRNLWSHSLKDLREIILYVSGHKQKLIQVATNKARDICRLKSFKEKYGEWRIADSRDPHWPAIDKPPAKVGWWVYDMWLPKAIATLAPEFLPEEDLSYDRQGNKESSSNVIRNHDANGKTTKGVSKQSSNSLPGGRHRCSGERDARNHSWHTVLQDYAIEDVESGLALWWFLREYLERAGLYVQYLERRRLLEITHEMKNVGVSLLPKNLDKEVERYSTEAALNSAKAERIAGEDVNLASSLQLRQVLYKDMGLPVLTKTKASKTFPKGQPKTDVETLQKLHDLCSSPTSTIASCPNQKLASEFISSLVLSRRNSKSVDYLKSYKEWSCGTVSTADKVSSGKSSGEAKTKERERVFTNSKRVCQDGRESNRGRRKYTAKVGGNGSVPGTILAKAPYVRRKKDTSGNSQQNSLPHSVYESIAWHNNFPRIHPNTNITGTKFTRQSYSSPNLQNVGTGKEEDFTENEGSSPQMDYQLRKVFGPQQGYVWISRDYSNIELRIWAYDCGNRELIEAFDLGVSIHLLIFRELWPQFKDLSDDDAKERPEYKWTKNGDFAILYGGTPRRVDATYKVRGGYDRVARRFPEVRSYTKTLHEQVSTRGFVNTLTGYRLYIPQSEPHKAVSGRVQGTAGSIIGRAMIDCFDYLRDKESNLILQVHDELVFEIPEREVKQVSLPLQQLMEGLGDGIGIPLTTGGKIHRSNWADGETV